MTSEFIGDIRAIATGELPEDVGLTAKCCILDWLGAALAGAHEPLAEMLLAEVATVPSAPCSLIGRDERTAPHAAALVNGAAGDALDFSDCNRAMNGHPTATVFPAVLALAEAEGASGAALLRAFVAGVEAACRVGSIVGTGVLETAFHPTAVAGPLGAAAGGAVLLGLDDARFAAALGIAATQAAGLAEAVGTMCKPLHAGTAAAAGVLAARLAGRGFSAPATALEPGGGFLASHTARVEPAALEASRGAFLIRRTLMKEHAACALTHGTIENMRALGRAHVAARDVATIRLEIAASSARVCDIVAPASGLEAKFSVRTVAAMALLGYDTASLASFENGLFEAPDVAELRARIAVVARNDLDVAVSRARVDLYGGRVVELETDERESIPGPASRRASASAKFRGLTARYLDARQAAELERRVFALETLAKFDVRP